MNVASFNTLFSKFKPLFMVNCLGYLLAMWVLCHSVVAATPAPFKQPHLPPTVQPNGFLSTTVPVKPTTANSTANEDTTLEPIELVDTPSLTLKQAEQASLTQPPTIAGTPNPNNSTLNNPVSVKALQVAAFNTLKPKEQLGVLEQQIQEADLQFLWNALVERNPVVRFSLEKIALPIENHDAHSSQFLRKSLSVLISGAALGSSLVLPAGGYETMGILAGSQAVQNIVNGKTKPVSNLTATEHIQLANLVDDLKRQLVENYQIYQQNLRSVQQAQPNTQLAYQHYQVAVRNQNPIEILTSLQVYHQALKQETLLKQQAKLARIKLERLCGQPSVSHLVLVAQPMIASTKTGVSLPQTAINITNTPNKNTLPNTNKQLTTTALPLVNHHAKPTSATLPPNSINKPPNSGIKIGSAPLLPNRSVGAAASIPTIKPKNLLLPIHTPKTTIPTHTAKINSSTTSKPAIQLRLKEDALF